MTQLKNNLHKNIKRERKNIPQIFLKLKKCFYYSPNFSDQSSYVVNIVFKHKRKDEY